MWKQITGGYRLTGQCQHEVDNQFTPPLSLSLTVTPTTSHLPFTSTPAPLKKKSLELLNQDVSYNY